MPVYNRDGLPVYHPTMVDATYREYFDIVARDAAAYAGYAVIEVLPGGDGRIVVNQAVIDARADVARLHPDDQVFAGTTGRVITVCDLDHIDDSLRTIMLAHEIGHAMGMPHSTHGLMAPELNYQECGRERAGPCLVNALREWFGR